MEKQKNPYVAIYENKKLDSEQKKVIESAIKDGMIYSKICLFAKNPDFSAVQMEEIKKGIKSGMSDEEIDIFANPEINAHDMSIIREKIKYFSKEQAELLVSYALRDDAISSIHISEIAKGIKAGLGKRQLNVLADKELTEEWASLLRESMEKGYPLEQTKNLKIWAEDRFGETRALYMAKHIEYAIANGLTVNELDKYCVGKTTDEVKASIDKFLYEKKIAESIEKMLTSEQVADIEGVVVLEEQEEEPQVDFADVARRRAEEEAKKLLEKQKEEERKAERKLKLVKIAVPTEDPEIRQNIKIDTVKTLFIPAESDKPEKYKRLSNAVVSTESGQKVGIVLDEYPRASKDKRYKISAVPISFELQTKGNAAKQTSITEHCDVDIIEKQHFATKKDAINAFQKTVTDFEDDPHLYEYITSLTNSGTKFNFADFNISKEQVRRFGKAKK